MNLKQIEVFRAVMQTGSTIGAAAVLKISQSAASRGLSQLEAELGLNERILCLPKLVLIEQAPS